MALWFSCKSYIFNAIMDKHGLISINFKEDDIRIGLDFFERVITNIVRLVLDDGEVHCFFRFDPLTL